MNENDVDRALEELRSERPPFGPADYAELRRRVWRKVETRGVAGASFPGRMLLAGGALAAAALVAAVLVRSVPRAPEAPGALPAPAAATVAAAVSPEPLAALALPTPPAPRHARRRAAPLGEEAPVKIEFQTANPDVRIIWLVKKGEEPPRLPARSQNEEVS